jgi:predicted DNA-binding transcriptional regulator AlpA
MQPTPTATKKTSKKTAPAARAPVRFSELDDSAVLRQNQIIPDLIPVGASTWLLWVRNGHAPKPHKIGPGVTVWRVGDLRAFLAKPQQQGDTDA